MKKTIVVSSMLLLLPISSLAQNNCVFLAMMAESLMSARQEGVPITKVIEILDKGEDKNINDLGKSLAKMAYAVPKYSTEPAKLRAVTEFENEVYLMCDK